MTSTPPSCGSTGENHPQPIRGDGNNNDPPLDVAGISFDATGTLFWCPKLGDIYSSVLTRHGLDVSADAAATAFRNAWQEFDCVADPRRDRWAVHPQGAKGWWADLIRRVGALAGVAEPTEFAIAELFHRFVQADAWEVYPETFEVLQRLKQLGVPAVVASNWDRRLHQVLVNLKLAPLFVGVVCSEDVGSAKPAPEVFDAARLALRAHSPRPEGRFIHVGDHALNDAEGAEAHGFEGVLLSRQGEGKADIRSLTELLTWARHAPAL